MAMAKRKKFKFPELLLTQINECSYGGFLLFNFDEYGEVQTFGTFDDKLALSAMERYITTWSKTIDAIAMEELSNSFKKPPRKRKDPPPGDEED